MRAITVCVEYTDLLEIALPATKRHFQEIVVVTAPQDQKTVALCRSLNVGTFVTDAFYRNGASFNKGLALEEGLDYFGRHGWMCILDSDVVIPETMTLPYLEIGKIYSPYRKIVTDIQRFDPRNANWGEYFRFPDCELAGYFQLFHADDPAILGKRPWYGTMWKHAGGCDSEFTFKWKDENKVRLQFDVLHLGEPEVNWHGRTTMMRGGVMPQGYEDRKRIHSESMETRRRNHSNVHEKLG